MLATGSLRRWRRPLATCAPDAASTGFTLLEMLVTLAIAGLVSAVGFPQIERMLLKTSFERTAQQLRLALLTARSEAIRTGATVRFNLAGDNRRFSTSVTAAVQLPDGLSVTAPARDIIFFRDGSASGGDIMLSSRFTRLRIHVDSATGAIGQAA